MADIWNDSISIFTGFDEVFTYSQTTIFATICCSAKNIIQKLQWCQTKPSFVICQNKSIFAMSYSYRISSRQQITSQRLLPHDILLVDTKLYWPMLEWWPWSWRASLVGESCRAEPVDWGSHTATQTPCLEDASQLITDKQISPLDQCLL